MNPVPTRRRFLSIAAASAAAIAASTSSASQAASAARAGAPRAAVWKGTAMGALASITLVHEDRAYAQAALVGCVDEIARIEAILSLYRPDSTLSKLNAAGELRDPPSELVELLSFSLALARASAGAFDPSVQPLYRLYADHFATPGAAAVGPSPRQIARALEAVDFTAIALDPQRIRLRRPAMALTLNGVAQGYVTDRVADLLHRTGFRNVLIDLGEARAAGRKADGRPWIAAVADPIAALADPGAAQPTLFELEMGDGAGQVAALATSAGYGTRFGADPRIHHLFDPHSGRSANHYASVSVAAGRATLADGLSTTLSILAPASAAALLSAWPSVRAYFTDASGHVTVRGGVHEAG